MSKQIAAIYVINVCLTGFPALAQTARALPNVTVRAATAGASTSCPSCSLAGTNLSGKKLSKVNFSGADLTGANLSGALLDGAILAGANLSNAILDNAVLSSTANGPASLIRANLSGAKVRKANLDGVQMQFAKTDGTDFTGTDLGKAIVAPVPRVMPRAAAATTTDWVCGSVAANTLPNRVYVSLRGAFQAPCGTSPTASCSIDAGITACSGAGCAVLVAYGEYQIERSLALKDGVSIYGGCVTPDMAASTNISVIDGPRDGSPVVTADGINSATVLQNLHLNALRAPGQGGQASIALLVSNSTGLSLVNSEILSNTGADGDVGGMVARGGAPGGTASGSSGGTSNCSAPGGNGGQQNTPTATVDGLTLSCSGTCDSAWLCSGAQGSAGSTGYFAAAGGTSGTSTCAECPTAQPGNGNGGEAGHDGVCGGGGVSNSNTAGAFSGTTWQSGYGGEGVTGGTGGGGGGGSSGGYMGGTCFGVKTEYYGSTGGGGGGGGCGGTGGKGGQQGGGSFPLVAVASRLTLTNSRLIAGQGGQGGRGGQAGIGGPSGHAADGGSPHTQAGTGGSGGNGGAGGGGGGGAGGNGGPAIGAALVANSTLTIKDLAKTDKSAIYAGLSGSVGSGVAGMPSGSGKCAGGTGSSGVAGLVADTQTY